MKSLFFISMLVLFVSCNSSSESKKCTFNGEEVPCSESTSDSNSDNLETGGAELVASLTTEINYDEYELETLENKSDLKREIVNGVEIECSVETEASASYRYELRNGKLVLNSEDEQVEFTKSKGNKNVLEGTWSRKDNHQGGYNVVTIEISKNKMKITTKCHFN
jgi:hypothetical protein